MTWYHPALAQRALDESDSEIRTLKAEVNRLRTLAAAAPDMLAALQNVQKLISEAAMTGFNWQDGDWPQRLFESQQVTSAAIKKATSSDPSDQSRGGA